MMSYNPHTVDVSVLSKHKLAIVKVTIVTSLKLLTQVLLALRSCDHIIAMTRADIGIAMYQY